MQYKPEYRFLHDSVQQAAYSSMSEDERKKLHLKIGRILLKELSEPELADRVFEVSGHFNQSCQVYENQEERLKDQLNN